MSDQPPPLPDTDGTSEARAAARWWADRLVEEGRPDTGDAGTDASVAVARKFSTPPTAEQVDVFRRALERLILERLVGHPSWEKAILSGYPDWGSSLRTVATEWIPDQTLGDAIEAAGLDGKSMGLLPAKTVMWVNPGHVSAAHGRGGEPETLILA